MIESQPSWIGRTIGGRYQIESLLGRGGMSSVYKATDPNLQRPVAIKLIHPHLSEQSEFVKRFEQEAAAVARLRHPNIVQVHDFDHDGGVYYMVLEHIPGETLEKRLASLKEANLRMPLEDTLRIMILLCDAVSFAHERNMIHRDLKPSNVVMNLLGQPILMDFGIAKIVGGNHVQTATGATIGTAAYMSPEQVLGEGAVDHRADIYSLGVMLYEMAAGKPPFEGKSAITVMMKHVNEPVPDVRLMNSNVPNVMVSVLQKALAKDPDERFQSAVEMGTALRTVAQQIFGTTSTQSFIGLSPAGRPASGSMPARSATEPPPEVGSEPAAVTGPEGPTPVVTSTVDALPATSVSHETPHSPARSNRTVPWLAVGLVLVLLLAAGLYWLWPRFSRQLPTSAGMVAIPAGTYTIGFSSGGSQYVPIQQIELDQFWIDRYEVDNNRFAEFVADTGSTPPSSWVNGVEPAAQGQHPVQGVTWELAQAYCAWANKRLPTEAEWEVAARGPQALLYPWGNEANTVPLPSGTTYPVGTIAANRSAFGVFDMAGNVWEWVTEPYAAIPDNQRILRGGAHDFMKDMAYRLQGDPSVPTMYSTAGFRCAADEVEVVEDDVVVDNAELPAETMLINDDFSNPESGWPEMSEGSALSGYHPPDYYHVQSGEPNHITTAFFGDSFDNISMEVQVFVDSTDTADGNFRYGVVLRRIGDRFYAFTVSPRSNAWYILKGTDAGLEVLEEGSIDSLQGLVTNSNDTLRVDAVGAHFTFSINGLQVAAVDDADYAAGDIGFIVQTFDESRAHIHYDTLTVQQGEFTSLTDVILQDNFLDPTSGWPEISDGSALSGYHPPDYYHVQSGEPNHTTTAFFTESFSDFTMEAVIFVDSTDTDSGDFYYGLAARRRGENYYAFMVSPRTNSWQVIKRSNEGETILAAGNDDSIQGLGAQDVLRIDASGADLLFHLNGRPIIRIQDNAYPDGDIGFIVSTLDESRAHVHYDTLTVRAVDIDLDAAPLAEMVGEPVVESEATAVTAEPTVEATAEATAEPTPDGPAPSSEGMVRVAAGSYIVGEDISVTLEEFWIDQYEVTNAQYATFLEETGEEAPEYWVEANIPTEMGDHPVEGLTWARANAYCQWAGKRLPSEAEWEVAARGPEGWRYPWGDNEQAVEIPVSGTYQVGSIPANRSFFGVFDMAGNVWEWIDQPYAPVTEGQRILRGGANNFPNDMLFRAAGDPNSSIMFANAGMRCAANRVTLEPNEMVRLRDDFSDLDSGWWQARAPIDAYFYGYHPTDFYHVQVSAPNECLSIYQELPLDNFMAEIEVFIAATDNEDGDFYYGLTLRETGSEFYALLISPRSQRWQVLKSMTEGLALLDEGSSETLSGDSQATRDRLFAIANGTELTFFVNGELVSQVYDADYTSGNIGFIVQTIDETYAHIHYDSIAVWNLPPAAVASSATPTAAAEYPIVAPLCRGSISTDETLVSFISHTVAANETLSDIALKYGVTVEAILGANGRTIENPGFIRTGQSVVIPQS